MANTSSAKKAVRSSATKKRSNDRIRKAYKLARKKVVDALHKGTEKFEEIVKNIPEAYKQIDKAVSKGIMHRNTASRYKSRIMHALKKVVKKD